MFDKSAIDKINVTFLELDKSKALNKSLVEEVELHKKNNKALSSMNEKLNDRYSILFIINEEHVKQRNLLTESVEKKNRKINLLKKSRYLWGGGGAVLGIAAYIITKSLTTK